MKVSWYLGCFGVLGYGGYGADLVVFFGYGAGLVVFLQLWCWSGGFLWLWGFSLEVVGAGLVASPLKVVGAGRRGWSVLEMRLSLAVVGDGGRYFGAGLLRAGCSWSHRRGANILGFDMGSWFFDS
ncbi:unnamed protein product [Amaranthus hypochondriacus]